ncbi:MAG: hypothetical protein RL681_306 [Candidatus Parcubacteria bacterium]|jgi:hypothetical protein
MRNLGLFVAGCVVGALAVAAYTIVFGEFPGEGGIRDLLGREDEQG